MGLRWLATLACLCMLAEFRQLAAMPTTDTIVVTKTEDEASTKSTDVVTDEVTTEEPNAPIKLTEMNVHSEVYLRYANTAVVAKMRNPAKRAQEAHFRVLLPETAFISGFVMTIDGKSYKAYVKEKEEAKQIYQDALNQGLGAAHVSAKARDSNHFTVTVNIEPLSAVVFNLTYEELLVRHLNVYEHVVNVHPGVLVPKLTITVHIKEAEKITELKVPEIRTGNEIDSIKDDTQNSKAVIERGHDDREATITFKPDLEEQQRLMQIYAQKAKESAANANRCSWCDPPPETEVDGVLGQFVVQYDVARPEGGEILVNDGYFVHFFAPTSLPPLSKYVVFVLDTSGSMMDRKIEQLREAMMTILSDLNPGDYFSIVEFASQVTVHTLKEADQEPPKEPNYYYYEMMNKPVKIPPRPAFPATPVNIAKAKVIISRLRANGGTNIYSALDVAVDLIQRRVSLAQGLTNTTAQDNKTTTETPQSTTALTPDENQPLSEEVVEQIKQLEPIIIFLTDGDPTVGISDTNTITNHITEKNDGPDMATIFALAFGNDADQKFLRKMSLRSHGFMRHIYEGGDAALQLQDFYRQVSSPLLSHVKFVYPPNQVKSDSLTKHNFRTYYAGSEVVVAGELDDSSTELAPQVLGFCGVVDGQGRKRYEKNPRVPVTPKRQGYFPLERLWAYLTIKQMLDEKDANEGSSQSVQVEDKDNTPEKKALRLALKYEFVTPLTSLVVVKPNSTNAVNAESVDNKDFARPTFGAAMAAPMAGVSYFASGLPGLPASSAFHSQMPVAAFEIAEEEEDYEAFDLALSTTPLPFNPLNTYGLQEFSWVRPLLNYTADALQFQVDTTEVSLKLSTNEAPKSLGGDKSCDQAVDGGAGVCVYLSRCDSAKTIAVDTYKTTYCAVDGYAGVCCNITKVDLIAVR